VDFLFPISYWIWVPLVAVPVAIHLINLRRQQRIRWAAMQFLQESQRRNRRWILLKQLLLLAARMTAIALLLLMLARLVLHNEWMGLFGRGTIHHLVLLDDSYSMSDRWDDKSALGEGKRAIEAIVDQAAQQSDTQLITILRYSEAARLSAGEQPKVYAEQINDSFRSRLESLLAGWSASQTDVGPAEALKAIPRLPLAKDQQTLVVYVISDFRTRQFGDATEVRKLLSDLQEKESVAQIHLVRCVREARPNLAITSLVPDSGVRAAGVEMWMNVRVANYGDAPARGVIVKLEQDGDALPALVLDDIPARDEVSHKFRVQFAGTGAHWLTASLAPDAIAVDNRRYYACDLPAARPVLIIDGSPDGRDGHELSLALAPGGTVRTGWQPHVESASFLADSKRLNEQAAVCLLDVPSLADDQLAALESYVRDGGGLAFFVGATTDRSFYNDRLYRNSEGLFPVPLKLPTQLVDRADDEVPDLEVTPHPLFQVLAGKRNGLLPLMMIDYYYSTPEGWTPPKDGTVQVIARLRNKEPLVVEKKFGNGRVVAHLTKLSSSDTPQGHWSNWGVNPAFPVLANEFVSYLAATLQVDPLYRVGDNLALSVEDGKYDSKMRVNLPEEAASDNGAPGRGPSRSEVTIDATSNRGQLRAQLESVATSGIYEARLQPLAGGVERRDFAVNVPIGEGDLALTNGPVLSRQLAGIDYQLHDAAEMALDAQQLAGFQMSDALLAVLVIILIVEQLLASIASYHIAPRRGGHA
jgi:hypothetical protein